MRSLIRQQIGGQATINALDLSGSGTLSLTGTATEWTYSTLKIDLDITASGFHIPTVTTVNGNFKAHLFTQNEGSGSGNFCLVVHEGHGTAEETDSFTGGFTFDLGPQDGWVTEVMIMDYTCNGNTLTMKGTVDGQAKMGPYVYTEVIPVRAEVWKYLRSAHRSWCV
jgi:hypothetical protein